MGSPSTLVNLQDYTTGPIPLEMPKKFEKSLNLGYQCPFIPNVTGFARPLTNLLKKDTPFEWTPNCCQALDTLIDIITLSLVLITPN